MIRGVIVLIIPLLILSACGGKQMSIEEFQSMAKEAEQQSQSIAERQADMRALLQAYDQAVPASARLKLNLDPECGLTPADFEKLSDRIDEEQDPSCLGILEQIAEIQGDIRDRCERLHEITAELPAPHRVVSGENHYTLCLDYLISKHHLKARTADSLVARVGLSSDIIEGFHVWFYYQNGIFGTFVTQGDAHISPTVFAKVVKKHLIEQARRQGHDDAFETILDSLKRSGALIANIKHHANSL